MGAPVTLIAGDAEIPPFHEQMAAEVCDAATARDIRKAAQAAP